MDASAGIEMIALPPGQVTLSDRRPQRRWSVELAPYQLAAFPITQARFAQVTGRRPSTAHGDQLPVETVSWWDAVRFCNALSQRVGPVRHAGQRVGVVLGPLRCRGLRHLSGAPWWWVVRRALELPGLGAAPQPPELPDRRRRIPHRALILRDGSTSGAVLSVQRYLQHDDDQAEGTVDQTRQQRPRPCPSTSAAHVDAPPDQLGHAVPQGKADRQPLAEQAERPQQQGCSRSRSPCWSSSVGHGGGDLVALAGRRRA